MRGKSHTLRGQPFRGTSTKTPIVLYITRADQLQRVRTEPSDKEHYRSLASHQGPQRVAIAILVQDLESQRAAEVGCGDAVHVDSIDY